MFVTEDASQFDKSALNPEALTNIDDISVTRFTAQVRRGEGVPDVAPLLKPVAPENILDMFVTEEVFQFPMF
jgi:hypothetical protein